MKAKKQKQTKKKNHCEDVGGNREGKQFSN
jgi:hypothetical protein